jgi:hypothetical protein
MPDIYLPPYAHVLALQRHVIRRYVFAATAYLAIRSFNCTVTRLPACFLIASRTAAFTGNMCLPSPIAMKELSNG